MRIDWSNKDSFQRLLAAMVAAQDMKLNYGKIATMYGQGATYDAIEGHFRKIRKEAIQLREEHDTRALSPSFTIPVVPSRKPRAKRTPKVKNEAGLLPVLGGRVKKPSASRKKSKAVKDEVAETCDFLDAEETELMLGSPSATFGFGTTDDIWLSNQHSFSHDFGI